MANQFSRRGPPERIKKKHDEASKDRMRAEKLSIRLYKYARASGEKAQKLHMEPSQVQAAKVLIERGKPALQAIEQRIIEQPKTEEEIKAQLRSLLSDPGVRAQLESMLKHSPVAVSADPDAQDSTQPLESTGTDD